MHDHSGADQTLGGPPRAAAHVDERSLRDDDEEPPRSRARLPMVEPRGGESLRALLSRRTSGAVLLRHLLRAMRSAAALHRRGVVHGDIRPENIFLTPGTEGREPRVKLLHRPGAGAHDLAHVYRAPEQRAGWLLDPRTDVYGFGVVLHEVLTGRLPADVHAPPRAGAGVFASSLGPDSEHVPAGLARLVERALQPDAALRPNSVTALMAAIEPYTRHAALRGPLPPRPRTLASLPARRSLRVHLSTVFAVLALACVMSLIFSALA